MKDMFEFLKDADNFEERKVNRTEINGLIVSTVLTSDEGYETAILDANGTHPVERYATKEHANEGHTKWCKKVPSLTEITKLGWLDGLVEEQQIRLARKGTLNDAT